MKKPSWQLEFDCSGCGACCRAISCVYLDEDTDKCLVYEIRPDVCRIGYSRPPDMPIDRYIEMTHEACKVLEMTYGKGKTARGQDHQTGHEDHQTEQGGLHPGGEA